MESWIAAYQSGARQPDPDLVETLQLTNADDWRVLLEWIVQAPPQDHEQQQFVSSTLGLLLERVRRPTSADEFATLLPVIADTYRQLRDRVSASYILPQLLSQIGGPRGLELFTDLLVTLPPTDASHVAAACSPLIQAERRADLPKLFPRLLDGIANLSAAAVILDLANYTARLKVVEVHPAWPRREQLADMLGRISQQMQRLDEQRPTVDPTIGKHRQLIGECVSLAVTICDALAQFGEPRFIGKLYQAFELRHRRIRVEAAFALARLGEKRGEDAVVELAADASTRLRALAYADELDIGARIPDEFQTEVARAESALALWLAEPSQMGIPPGRLELVDRRELFWPGFQEAIDCFLFRFTYPLPLGDFTNVGIAGPLTRASSANLNALTPDDTYALFAGWQADHDDIFECDVGRLSERNERDAKRLEQRLRADGFREVQPLWMGFFFGEKALVARACRHDARGVVVVDDEAAEWWPETDEGQPLGPDEAFSIYKGRKLLAAFNE